MLAVLFSVWLAMINAGGGGGWEGLGQVQCACTGTLCFLLALFQKFVILDGTCFIAKAR